MGCLFNDLYSIRMSVNLSQASQYVCFWMETNTIKAVDWGKNKHCYIQTFSVSYNDVGKILIYCSPECRCSAQTSGALKSNVPPRREARPLSSPPRSQSAPSFDSNFGNEMSWPCPVPCSRNHPDRLFQLSHAENRDSSAAKVINSLV